MMSIIARQATICAMPSGATWRVKAAGVILSTELVPGIFPGTLGIGPPYRDKVAGRGFQIEVS